MIAGLVGAAIAVGAAGRSPPAGLAAALAAGTVLLLVRSARRRRAERTRRQALLQTLDLLARDLAAGTSLTASVERVALFAPAAIRPLLADDALRSRFGAAPADVATGRIDAALLSTFAVAGRHGSATAEVLSAFAGTLRDELEAADRHAAATAGAQLSGWLLAALPLVGLAIGAGIGANPIPVLLHTVVGGALLVTGTALCCAGLLWSARLAR